MNAIKTIFFVLFSVLILIHLHTYFFGVVGIFKAKKFPKVKEKCKFGILIPARNEDKVIAELIESIQTANYDQSKLDIFVIAHNSTDKTYEICSKIKGVHVYKYDNNNERTKGYALNHLVKQIAKDFKIESYDGFFSFDADNLVDKEYFNNMNDAFCYYNKNYTIIGNRIAKNFSQNPLSAAYGFFFMADGYYIYRGRTALNESVKNGGTGYLMPTCRIKNGFNYFGVTEDWEMSVDEVFRNERGAHCDTAIFYDEQPSTLKVMWKQRLRWVFGHLEIYTKQLLPMLKYIFKKDTKNRFNAYDMLTTFTPISLFVLGLFILQTITYSIIPLIDKTITYQYLFFNYNNGISFVQNIIFSDGLLFILLKSFIFTYTFFFILTIILLVLTRKIKFKRKPLIVVMAMFFWPIFVLLEIPISVHALIKHSLHWNPTPHKENIHINSINK